MTNSTIIIWETLLRSFTMHSQVIFTSITDDPWSFGPYILNVFKLDPGEGIWVPVGEIHAYVLGDCIEENMFQFLKISSVVF